MPNWSDFLPDMAYAGAYGTGTPQEEATRAPTPLYNATRGAINAAMVPGQVLQSRTPVTSGQMVGPATDLASFVTLGTGAMPAEADALRMGIRAYHGSPHDFEKFDPSKIGTGEGAKSYGHGLYFAGNEEVAKSYRDALAGSTVDGKPFNPDNPLHQAAARIEEQGSRAAAMDEMERRIASDPGDDMHHRVLAMLRHRPEIPPIRPASGHMYEVNINAQPSDFLDWDKPLSQQSPSVQAALAQRGIKTEPGVKMDNAALDDVLSAINNNTERPKIASDPLGRNIYESSKLVPGAYRNPQGASEALREAGVPGIKYLDQGSRIGGDAARIVENYGSREKALEVAQQRLKNASTGDLRYWDDIVKQLQTPITSNYVLFNDKLVDILRKYGWAGLGALPAMQGREEKT